MEIDHDGCLPHGINLTVQGALKDSKEIVDLQNKMKATITYTKTSSNGKRELFRCQEVNGLSK